MERTPPVHRESSNSGRAQGDTPRPRSADRLDFLHIQVQPQRDAVHRDRVPGRREGSMDAPPEQQEDSGRHAGPTNNQPAAFRDHLRRAG